MKFQSYRLNDDVVMIRKLNNRSWENAHLIYYNQFNQKTESEISPFERHLTYLSTCLSTCHIFIIQVDDIPVQQYIATLPLA